MELLGVSLRHTDKYATIVKFNKITKLFTGCGLKIAGHRDTPVGLPIVVPTSPVFDKANSTIVYASNVGT